MSWLKFISILTIKMTLTFIVMSWLSVPLGKQVTEPRVTTVNIALTVVMFSDLKYLTG